MFTHARLESVRAARLQLLDLGDTKTAASLAWADDLRLAAAEHRIAREARVGHTSFGVGVQRLSAARAPTPLVADLLDHINALSEKLGDAAPDQRELLSKVNAWLEQREQVQAPRVMPLEVAAMPADWSVTVQVDAETVLSIGHDWISGTTDFDEAVILGAAKHLLSFIGYGLPDGGFVPPADVPAITAAADAPEPVATFRRIAEYAENLERAGENATAVRGLLLALNSESNAVPEQVALTDEQIDALNPYKHSKGSAAIWRNGFDAALRYRPPVLAASQPAPAEETLPAGVVVSAYRFNEQITIQRMSQIDGPDLWAVRNRFSEALNAHGEWEWEPMPSSRDDAFLARCRYPSSGAAIAAALQREDADRNNPKD